MGSKYFWCFSMAYIYIFEAKGLGQFAKLVKEKSIKSYVGEK